MRPRRTATGRTRWRWILCLAIFALALVGALWQPHDPHAVDVRNALSPPSALHPLGTDHVGRDVASRLAAGAAPSLIAVAVALSATLGLGILAGLLITLGNPLARTVVARLAEIALAVPTLVLALVFAALVGPGPLSAALAFALTAWAPYALATAGLAETVMVRPYWLAARALGTPVPQALAHHLLPALRGPLGALAGADAGRAIILVASLGFLGLTADSGRPDWGAMIHEYRLFAFERPLLVAAPVGAIAALSLALNLVLDTAAEPRSRSAGRHAISFLQRPADRT